MLHIIALKRLVEKAANFHILLITGLHAKAFSMGGEAASNGVCS